jgi:adenine-specific DNA-methyltransferase
MENSSFLKEQLITYLGNKRSLLNFIDNIIKIVKNELGEDKVVTFDGFSGSGCVARYLKQHSKLIITNDLEKYSSIINDSFLKNKSEIDMEQIETYTELINKKKFRDDLGVGIIERLYSPKNTKSPQPGERCFYTNENAKIIDNIRRTIDLEVPEEYKNIFISILLHEASVHANTSGVFKGFYKGLKSDRGKFGGEKENALERILGEITIKPIILSNFDSERRIYQKNTNDLVKELDVDIDITYYDPPYNQHPYGSNYHILNTIVDYVEPQELSEVAGIPKNWNKSDYNKKTLAITSFDELIQNTKSKYIIISYNNEGFISYDEMMKICNKKGETRVFDEQYNAFRGSRNLKDRNNKVTEFIFLIKTY